MNNSGSSHPIMAWFRREGRLQIAILAALFLAVAGLWGFGMLAEEVGEGHTSKFDARILLSLRHADNLAVPIGPQWTLQVARDVTAFGGVAGLGLITAAVAGYLALERRFGLLTLVLVSVLGGSALSTLLKDVFQRPRPEVVPHLTDIASSSFPSGHSMLSSVVYLTLGALLSRAVPDRRTKVYFLVVPMVLIMLIGFSRVYLGVHYPTDVLAGWCAGSAWAAICCVVAHFLAGRADLPRAAELAEKTER